ncbi:alpha-1,6-glucosidase domain-containing protein, partial [Streptomyces eurythermus]
QQHITALAGTPYTLHPVQATGSDDTVKTSSYEAGSGTFTVPARTVAVFTRAGN